MSFNSCCLYFIVIIIKKFALIIVVVVVAIINNFINLMLDYFHYICVDFKLDLMFISITIIDATSDPNNSDFKPPLIIIFLRSIR